MIIYCDFPPKFPQILKKFRNLRSRRSRLFQVCSLVAEGMYLPLLVCVVGVQGSGLAMDLGLAQDLGDLVLASRARGLTLARTLPQDQALTLARTLGQDQKELMASRVAVRASPGTWAPGHLANRPPARWLLAAELPPLRAAQIQVSGVRCQKVINADLQIGGSKNKRGAMKSPGKLQDLIY